VNLRSRIVHRDSPVEVGQYETLRWTENPESYLRRSLSRALFEDGGMEQGLKPSVPTIDIELIAFEEVRLSNKHAGRVQLRYQLRRESEVIASGYITKERDAGSGIEPAVIAIGEAMDDATAELSSIVATRMRSAIASE
jgi:ABC-type uncharacterized transport system auxiliary subunit